MGIHMRDLQCYTIWWKCVQTKWAEMQEVDIYDIVAFTIHPNGKYKHPKRIKMYLLAMTL